MIWNYLVLLIKILIIIIPILIGVAYFTLAERKVLGAIHRRRGPNVVGVYGLLQPLSDGFKLFIKESILPGSANPFIFIISPLLSFIVSLLGWAVMPFSEYGFLSQFSIGILYLFAVSSLGVYGIILAGWGSNSKYAFLGAMRSAAQMVSYEASIGFVILSICVICGSFDLYEIVEYQKDVWFFLPFFPLFLLFFVCALAETNRHPFDLPEAEAELVSGYNVEYSGMAFALFSLAEYSNMLIISVVMIILFFGGWYSPFIFPDLIANILPFTSIFFGLKVCFFVILFIWARAALPRYRYDQLMELGWKIFLPASIGCLIWIYTYLYTFQLFPI